MLHLLMNRDYWSYLSMQSCVNLIEFIKGTLKVGGNIPLKYCISGV